MAEQWGRGRIDRRRRAEFPISQHFERGLPIWDARMGGGKFRRAAIAPAGAQNSSFPTKGFPASVVQHGNHDDTTHSPDLL